MTRSWIVHHRKGLELPLLRGPLRFAVKVGGYTSNGWRVWTERSDAYICCRDDLQDIKISLHRSGRQHVAFRAESGLEMTPGSRFWNQWREPPHQSPAVPSFKLVFPTWGIRLTEADRNRTSALRKKWDENHILLEAEEGMAVVVSFFVLDQATSPKFSGDYPQALMGVLPLSDKKSLFVVGSNVPEGNLRAKVEAAIAAVGPEFARKLLQSQNGEDAAVACLTGDSGEGYAYMAVVPVEVKAGAGI